MCNMKQFLRGYQSLIPILPLFEFIGFLFGRLLSVPGFICGYCVSFRSYELYVSVFLTR